MNLYNEFKERGYSNSEIMKLLHLSHYKAFRVLRYPKLATVKDLRYISKALGIDFIDLCAVIYRKEYPQDRV